jgi:hypothetical protein
MQYFISAVNNRTFLFAKKLLKRGSNFERLIEHHHTHYRSLDKILKSLNDNRIDYRVAQRYDFKPDDIEWANCIFTAGGDGKAFEFTLFFSFFF